MFAKLISGIALYTYHKYQKSMASNIPLDEHGRPLDPEHGGESHFYARAHASHEETRLAGHPSPGLYTDRDAVPLNSLDRRGDPDETDEDRANRLRDDFEGWGRRDDDWSDAESEADAEEVEQRRQDRQERAGAIKGEKSWGLWWDKSM
jgi:solute carrier family 35 protein C2